MALSLDQTRKTTRTKASTSTNKTPLNAKTKKKANATPANKEALAKASKPVSVTTEGSNTLTRSKKKAKKRKPIKPWESTAKTKAPRVRKPRKIDKDIPMTGLNEHPVSEITITESLFFKAVNCNWDDIKSAPQNWQEIADDVLSSLRPHGLVFRWLHKGYEWGKGIQFKPKLKVPFPFKNID